MPKTFVQQVALLRHGDLNDELDEKIAELIAECKATGKTGELILKLKIKPGTSGQAEIFDTVDLKLPKPARETSILFINDDASLQREDPRQRTLEGVKDVTERVPPREVRDPTKKSA